jgi:hypothetical protein
MSIVLATLLVACAAPSDDAAIRGRIYSATATEELAKDGYAYDVKDAAPYWTPSDQQIHALEDALPEYLKKNWPTGRGPLENPETYERQYFGVTREGRQLIFINALCSSYAKATPGWKDRFVFVFDGGACFFQLYYDPVSKQFRDLRVNGVA